MTSRLDDLYSRLDQQSQQSLTGSFTSGGKTVTPTRATTTAPSKADVKAARKLTAAQDSGYDLTQAANASMVSGAPQGSSASSLSPTASNLGAGGRSRYTDEEIAFMTGGGGTTPAPAPKVTSTGGGGGGGGGSTAPTQPEAPTGPAAPTAGVADGNFGQFTEAEIDAALRGIEAEFGMTREQLLADKSMIGAQYRLLMAQMTRARQQAVQGATSDAVGRGIYRSGILGENIANIEQQFGEQESNTRQQQMIQEQALERQLAFLDQGQAAAGAQAQNNILGQAAATMTQAGVNPTQAGFGQGAVQMPGLGQGAPAAPGAFGAANIGGVIPRAPAGPGDISGQAPPAASNPYASYPVVGGYYIDPNTGMAVARVDGR